MTANVETRVVVVDAKVVNFGLARAGFPLSTTVTVKSLSAVETPWSMACVSVQDPQQQEDASLHSYRRLTAADVVKVTPSHGTLPAHGECEVTLTLLSTDAGRLDGALECTTADGAESRRLVGVLGEVSRPQACLKSCHCDLGTIYVGSEAMATATIVNMTHLTSAFVVALGGDGDGEGAPPEHPSTATVEMVGDATGTLPPSSSVDVRLRVRALRAGEWKRTVMVVIDGAESALPLEIVVVVRDLSVTVECEPHDSAVPDSVSGSDAASRRSVDFGVCRAYVPSVRRRVRVTNTSGRAADFTFRALGFAATVDVASLMDTLRERDAVAEARGGAAPRLPAPPMERKVTGPAFLRARASSPRQVQEVSGVLLFFFAFL